MVTLVGVRARVLADGACGVDIARHERVDGELAGSNDDVEFNAQTRADVFRQRRHELLGIGESGGAQRDDHAPTVFGNREALGEVFQLIEAFEHLACTLVERQADGRGLHAVVATDEQTRSELAFELRDGLRYRLYRHVLTLCRSGQRGALDGVHEVSNLSNVHAACFSLDDPSVTGGGTPPRPVHSVLLYAEK